MKRPLATLSLLPPGKACLHMAAASVVGFVLLRVDFLAIVAALLLGALGATALLCRMSLRGFGAVALARSPRARCGEPFSLELRIVNRNRLVPLCFPYVETRESGEGRVEQFRYPGVVRARSSVSWDIQPTIHRRGLHRVEAVYAATRFPLGFVEAIVDCDACGPDTVVWPAFDPVNIDALLRPSARAAPLDEGPHTGAASLVDRSLIRDYQSGDSARSINWKLSAKLDKLMVIETRHHSLPKLRLRLDTSDPRWLPTPYFERMLRLVCSLAASLLKRQRLAGIELDGRYFPIPDGQRLARFLDALSVAEPREPTRAPQETTLAYPINEYLIAPDGRGGIALERAKASTPRP